MSRRPPLLRGERVLVSRAQDGENHEEATVVDFYELLIEGDKIPSVVVDFDDGERLYLTAREPNVLPIDLEDPELDDEDDWDEDDDEDDDETRTTRIPSSRTTTPSAATRTRGRRLRRSPASMEGDGAGNRDDARQERPRRDAQGRGDHGRRRRRAGADRRGGGRGLGDGARARPGRHQGPGRRRPDVRPGHDPRDPGGGLDPGDGEVPDRPLRRGADPAVARDRLHRRVGGADSRRPRAPCRQVGLHRAVRLRRDQSRRGAAAHLRGRGDDPHEGRGRDRRHRQRRHAHALGVRRRSGGSGRSAPRSSTPRRRTLQRAARARPVGRPARPPAGRHLHRRRHRHAGRRRALHAARRRRRLRRLGHLQVRATPPSAPARSSRRRRTTWTPTCSPACPRASARRWSASRPPRSTPKSCSRRAAGRDSAYQTLSNVPSRSSCSYWNDVSSTRRMYSSRFAATNSL